MQPRILTSPAPRPTIEEWFSRPFVQTLDTSESLGWNNVIVRCAKLNATLDFQATPITQAHTLVLTLEGSAHLEAHVIGGQYFKKHITAGALMVNPRSCEAMDGRWDSPVTALFVELSHDVMADMAASTCRGDPEHVEILQSIGFYDPFLRHLATEIYGEMQNRRLFGALFAESVGNTIALHLLRKYSNVSIVRQVCGGQLTPLQLRVVNEYIHEHLDQKISLADLAGCIHVSVPHFEKMFRATLHCPPYRYVLERRIERAKLLLSNTQLSLYEIARDCGFANQSHLTRHFTKLIGVSPARYMTSPRSAE